MINRAKKHIQLIFSSELFSHVSTLITGTTIAQLIPILIQPILRRFYSTEEFGVYAVYLSIIGVLYVITSLRYEQASIIPKDDNEAVNILFLSQIINLILSIFLAIISLLFLPVIINLLNIPSQYSKYILIVPLATFLFNLHQAINLWLIRKKSFMPVSKNKLVRRTSEGISQILFRYLKVGNGLLIGDLIGHIANILYGFRQLTKTGYFKHTISKKTLLSVKSEYIDYPKYNTITTFLNAIGLLLPILIINKFYGPELTAYFDLSRLLLLTPIALLGSSISNVLLQRFAENKKKHKPLKKELLFVIGIGVLIGLFEISFIMLLGENLFKFLFGPEWGFSGVISKYLVWPYVIYFFTFALTSIFLALGKIRFLSLFQFFHFILILSLIFLKNQDFIVFIKVFTIINVLSSIIFGIMLYRILKNYNKLCDIKKLDIDG